MVIARRLDAPRDLVFLAWTDPKRVAVWWGPHGFTNPVCELDVRPGGAIRIDMRAPDGTVHTMTGVYREVVEPERLVFGSVALDQVGRPLFEVLNTVTFADEGGGTALAVRLRVQRATPEAARHLAGNEVGWNQQLDRLAEHLGSTAADEAAGVEREIVVRRVFDAARERVFQMWTEAEHVSRWWGPQGFTTTIREMDVRPGGVWRFVMHGPDGTDYENEIVYVEVVQAERLVYDHLVDPRFRHEVTFAERDGQTEVTVRMIFESADLRDRAAREHGAVEGLHQTLDRLARRLAAPAAG